MRIFRFIGIIYIFFWCHNTVRLGRRGVRSFRIFRIFRMIILFRPYLVFNHIVLCSVNLTTIKLTPVWYDRVNVKDCNKGCPYTIVEVFWPFKERDKDISK